MTIRLIDLNTDFPFPQNGQIRSLLTASDSTELNLLFFIDCFVA